MIRKPSSGVTCADLTRTRKKPGVKAASCSCGNPIRARTDFALIESNLELIAAQLARVPTRVYLCLTLLLSTARVWALLLALLLR
jgi:hypothetical protein